MQSEIDQVEATLEHAEAALALGEKMQKLAANKDFQDIIINGYFKDEAARLTGLLGDPQFKDSQDEIMKDLHAISSFQRYCRQIIRNGEMAQKSIIDCKAALDELRIEGE